MAFGYSLEEMNHLENQFVTEETLQDPLNINLDKGGKNKFSRYEEVNRRIGKSISQKRRENPELWPSRKGKENNRAASWKLISPSGEEYNIFGTLSEFCKNMGISEHTIRKAVMEGWRPRRGSCAGWQAFNLTLGRGTTRDTLNHGDAFSGENNPYRRSTSKKNRSQVD